MNEPTLAALHLLQSRIQTLKLLPRTGWLQRGMREVESIADHSFGVASLALVVGDLHPHLDRGRVLAIAIVHDMAEALIGDLPASASRLIGKAAKSEAERRAMHELFADHPLCGQYVALWEEYSTAASAEARLVKALDRLELLAQTLAYERVGTRNLDEFWTDCHIWSDEFPLVRAMAERLCAEHEALLGITERTV